MTILWENATLVSEGTIIGIVDSRYYMSIICPRSAEIGHQKLNSGVYLYWSGLLVNLVTLDNWLGHNVSENFVNQELMVKSSPHLTMCRF